MFWSAFAQWFAQRMQETYLLPRRMRFEWTNTVCSLSTLSQTCSIICGLTGLQGTITPKELYIFFKEIYSLWVALGEFAELNVYDVVDEIIDMVQPLRPPEITLQDLLGCKMAGTVFSMLSDVQLFYEYNYRENFMHNNEN